jgi:hypothetical protein
MGWLHKPHVLSYAEGTTERTAEDLLCEGCEFIAVFTQWDFTDGTVGSARCVYCLRPVEPQEAPQRVQHGGRPVLLAANLCTPPACAHSVEATEA